MTRNRQLELLFSRKRLYCPNFPSVSGPRVGGRDRAGPPPFPWSLRGVHREFSKRVGAPSPGAGRGHAVTRPQASLWQCVRPGPSGSRMSLSTCLSDPPCRLQAVGHLIAEQKPTPVLCVSHTSLFSLLNCLAFPRFPSPLYVPL